MAYVPFFALTTRGLEFVSAQEIAAVRGVSGVESAYRRVTGQISESPARLLSLRTVDDVYIAVDTWYSIGHQRSTLAVFTEHARQLALHDAIDQIRSFRRISDPSVFSATASFVGKRNYTSEEIKLALASGIQECCGWTYTPDDREADLNLRLFIEHEAAYVGVRLARHALHERPYKKTQIAGSLKPSVAAALVMLVGLKRGARVLDPFCGAGTILAEARAMGCDAVGGDLSLEALAAAQMNTPDAPLVCWDAGSLPLREATFDAVVSNFPWGRQIAVDESLDVLSRRALSEIRRVLKPGSPAVLLTNDFQLGGNGFEVIQQIEISLFGQKPMVTVLKTKW